MNARPPVFAAMLGLLVALNCSIAPAAVEMEGWGDLRGFRIDGQLFPVSTSIRVVSADLKEAENTGRWQQRDIHFSDDGKTQQFSGRFGLHRSQQFFLYETTVEQIDSTRARINVRVIPQQDSSLEGIYFCVSAPLADYAGADVQFLGAAGPTTRSAEIATTRPATDRYYLHSPASGALLKGTSSSLQVEFDAARDVLVRDVHDPRGDQVGMRILLRSGNVKKDDAINASFTIEFSGQASHEPATITLDPAKKGSEFAGIGGNFVFSLDAPDVKFNLEHLPPAWARMAVPLAKWQPVEAVDPDLTKPADVDAPGSDIRSALEMARVLDRRGIPLIFTVWVPPTWAISNPKPDEPYAEGRIVNPAKWNAVCNAIASYLIYAKSQYGVVPKLFSFNETDLGVVIKLTPQEYHDVMSKLGACFAAHGITTKLLIGDVSNPRPVDFINVAVTDPELMRHAGAISYHSWNGATDEQLAAWHTAAVKAGLPLIVAEGGTDSDAYRYPHVFGYTWYAIDEAATYLDTLAYAQPISILPWEMTSDYGLIDFHGPTPAPYKRFWCLKQLADTTAPHSVEIQTTCDQPSLHTAALLDPSGKACAIHIANAGAERDVTVSGVPTNIDHLQLYLTDETHNFEPKGAIPVVEGTAHFKLPTLSYVTLAPR